MRRAVAFALMLLFSSFARAEDLATVAAPWARCVSAELVDFAQKTKDPADVIVMGAYGLCEEMLIKALTVFVHANNEAPKEIRPTALALEEAGRNRYIGAVLQQRASSQP